MQGSSVNSPQDPGAVPAWQATSVPGHGPEYSGAEAGTGGAGGAEDPAVNDSAPAEEKKAGVKPPRRGDVPIAAGVYLVAVVVAFGWGYDLFAKLFDLVHNRCTPKSLTAVQCDLVRPPASALWGLLIAGGGMGLGLVGGLVLAAVCAMTGRRAWIAAAVALPVVVLAGGIGHVLVTSAIG